MPHFVVEYAAGDDVIQGQQLVRLVFDAAIASTLFSLADIKVRAYPCAHYQIGEGDRQFIHVTAKIMPGRSDEQKQALCQHVLTKLQSEAGEKWFITVEVLELNRDSYAKGIGMRTVPII